MAFFNAQSDKCDFRFAAFFQHPRRVGKMLALNFTAPWSRL
jgi:hypothetical protein